MTEVDIASVPAPRGFTHRVVVPAPGTLDALRFHAEQLTELATRLRDGEAPASAESLVAQLVRQAGRRRLAVRTSYAAAPAPDDPFDRLQRSLLTDNPRGCVLLTQDAAADAAWATRLAETGAQVRVHDSAIPTAAVVDGRVAVLAGEDGRLGAVADPVAVRAVEAYYAAVWQHAVDLAEIREVDIAWDPDGVPRRVLALLASGDTDEAAARKLDLSVRTYRRHVAEVMAQLGARSRFQAGVRAGRLGLVDAPAD